MSLNANQSMIPIPFGQVFFRAEHLQNIIQLLYICSTFTQLL